MDHTASMKLTTTDPMEQIIERALIEQRLRYTTDLGGGNPAALDFYLQDFDLHIEVKRMHSDRIAAQMARAPNVLVAQGEPAVRLLAEMIRAGGLKPTNVSIAQPRPPVLPGPSFG